MVNLILLAISLLIGSGICKPTYSDYSEYTYDVLNLTSLQLEASDELSLAEDDVVITNKRDLSVIKDNIATNLTGQQTILLTDIISKVEGSLIHSAYDIVSVFKITNQTNTDNLDEAIHKNTNATKDEDENQQIPLFTSVSSSGLVPANLNMTAHNEQSNVTERVEETFDKQQTTEMDVLKMGKQKRSISTTPTITTTTTTRFSEIDATQHSSTITPDDDRRHSTRLEATSVVSHSTESTRPTESHKSSQLAATNVNPLTNHPKNDGSTNLSALSTTSEISPVSTTTTTTTQVVTASTTKTNSVKELKETEEELKEKVAEIQAEPVILSSRI